jgi:hypothetical protein
VGYQNWPILLNLLILKYLKFKERFLLLNILANVTLRVWARESILPIEVSLVQARLFMSECDGGIHYGSDRNGTGDLCDCNWLGRLRVVHSHRGLVGAGTRLRPLPWPVIGRFIESVKIAPKLPMVSSIGAVHNHSNFNNTKASLTLKPKLFPHPAKVVGTLRRVLISVFQILQPLNDLVARLWISGAGPASVWAHPGFRGSARSVRPAAEPAPRGGRSGPSGLVRH